MMPSIDIVSAILMIIVIAELALIYIRLGETKKKD